MDGCTEVELTRRRDKSRTAHVVSDGGGLDNGGDDAWRQLEGVERIRRRLDRFAQAKAGELS
jgi:hypothetical protein